MRGSGASKAPGLWRSRACLRKASFWQVHGFRGERNGEMTPVARERYRAQRLRAPGQSAGCCWELGSGGWGLTGAQPGLGACLSLCGSKAHCISPLAAKLLWHSLALPPLMLMQFPGLGCGGPHGRVQMPGQLAGRPAGRGPQGQQRTGRMRTRTSRGTQWQ